MRYRVDDIEVTRPLAPLEFTGGGTGAALLLRRGGVAPLAFTCGRKLASSRGLQKS
jgi:hypothetical protein